MYNLYGDGIHDDQPAIQEMIDSGVCEVSLPAPQKHMEDKYYHFPLIWIQEDTAVKYLAVHHLHRREWENPIDAIHIGQWAVVETLRPQDITVENHTGEHCPAFVNNGTVKNLQGDLP